MVTLEILEFYTWLDEKLAETEVFWVRFGVFWK